MWADADRLDTSYSSLGRVVIAKEYGAVCRRSAVIRE